MLTQDQIDEWRAGPGLLGITGKAGSGKSTAAEYLVQNGWHRIKFADPLKDMLRAIGLDNRHIEGELKELPCDILSGATPRHAMQTLGTEWGRGMIHPDLWIDLARRKISLAMASGLSVVVDDVRFENEAQVIRDLGGMVLGLERHGAGAGGHVSESGVSCDLTYHNAGTVAELQGYMAYVFQGPIAV